MIFSRRAQTIMEYVILISIITMAVMVMLPRIKRTTQSVIKTAADQIGDQAGAEQTFNDYEKGYLKSSNSATTSFINNERWDINGSVDQTFNEVSTSTTNSQTFMGWQKAE